MATAWSKHVARIGNDGLYYASVAYYHKQEKNEIDDEQGDASALMMRQIARWVDEVVHCGPLSDSILALSRKDRRTREQSNKIPSDVSDNAGEKQRNNSC